MLFRTDANRVIGAGHLMRCLALAKTARSYGIESLFSLADTETTWQVLLDKEELAHTSIDPSDDSKATGSLAADFGAAWAVVDGYRFDAPYYRSLKEFAGSSILALDDGLDPGPLPVDAILNGNPYAEPSFYAAYDPRVDRLVGSEFAPLDPRFRELRERRPHPKEPPCRVLLTFGGSDAGESIRAAIQALANLTVSVRVTVIGSIPEGLRTTGLEIEELSFTHRIADLMAEMDFAICGGGSTTLQLACLGVPCLVIPIAENQRILVRTLEDAGVILSVPKGADPAPPLRELLNPNRMETMSAAGRTLIDGRGTNRIIEHIFSPN